MYLGLKPLLEYELLLIRLELSPQWQLGPKGFPLLESVLVLVGPELPSLQPTRLQVECWEQLGRLD